MNTGIISTRYATALLKYVEETGGGERVCTQVQQLLAHPEDMGAVELEPELGKFIALLMENGRMQDVRLILRSFVAMYNESRGISLVHLTSAVPSPTLEERLKGLLEAKFGCRVIFESDVDPDLIGGFRLQIGDYMLDASVRRQIETIRREFVISNNRIV